MNDMDCKKFAETISKFCLTKEEAKEFQNVMVMGRLGVEAAKAGEALRKMLLSLKKLKEIKPKYRAWENPYK